MVVAALVGSDNMVSIEILVTMMVVVIVDDIDNGDDHGYGWQHNGYNSDNNR